MASESIRQRFVRWRLDDLLIKYNGLRLASVSHGSVKIAGALAFVAGARHKEEIDDEFQIELSIPADFPERIPSVQETGGRIPSGFHKLEDGSLCLGSPTRLRLILTESASILRFVERCVIPYLYGYLFFKRHGIMPFGELRHGEEGLREDLASLFGIDGRDAVSAFVRLTAMRKRHANKQSCPCGSKRRLGRCHNVRVNTLRERLGRHWFRGYFALSNKRA